MSKSCELFLFFSTGYEIQAKQYSVLSHRRVQIQQQYTDRCLRACFKSMVLDADPTENPCGRAAGHDIFWVCLANDSCSAGAFKKQTAFPSKILVAQPCIVVSGSPATGALQQTCVTVVILLKHALRLFLFLTWSTYSCSQQSNFISF